MRTQHTLFAIDDASQTGEARRAAVHLAAEAGFDSETSGRAALVVTELGTNLNRHATRGRIMLMRLGNSSGLADIEVVAIDSGPGMADVANSLRDGVSTWTTPGTGLGAVRRMADDFSMFSQRGMGTVVCARVRARRSAASTGQRSKIEFGAVCLPAPGETVAGDAWDVRAEGHRASAIVADGLGHGPHAAAAAQAALAAFARRPASRPAEVIQFAHEGIRDTRGAAVGVAELDAEAGTIMFAGAGNVAGRVITGTADRSLLSQNGTVGVQINRVRDVEYAWPEHAIVVLYSDGLISRWSLDDCAGVMQCDPTVIAAWLLRGHYRGRDDCTVVVLRRRIS
jgi:anti-sigma regulatory factor (Ser/Thr protein kinase)